MWGWVLWWAAPVVCRDKYLLVSWVDWWWGGGAMVGIESQSDGA